MDAGVLTLSSSTYRTVAGTITPAAGAGTLVAQSPDRMRIFMLFMTVLVMPLQTQAQQQARPPSAWPCGGTIDPAYVQIAEATGGVVLPFHPTEAGGLGAEMIASRRHEETVLRAGGRVDDGLHEFHVPIDSTIESVYFLVALQCLQMSEIITPTGDRLNTAAGGVESHQFEAIHMFVVPKPTPGIWKVTIGGRGLLTFMVKATSDLRLGGVTFVDRGARLTGQRLGKALRLEVTMRGAAGPVAFHFAGQNAAALQPAPLQLEEGPDESRTYAGDVTTPAVAFRVAAAGIDRNGFHFLRVDERLSTPDR
jgi:hypothetical protein